MSTLTRLLRLNLQFTYPRLTTTTTSSFRPITRLTQLQSRFHASLPNMSDTKTYRANGDNGDDGSTEGDLNQWKFRAPYKVHGNDPNFKVRYEGSCHCGKIKYQLSREVPLDAKYCHCTTCQKIHGTFPMLYLHTYKLHGKDH